MKRWIVPIVCLLQMYAAHAANLDAVADRVLGEPDFATAAAGTTATQIGTAFGLGVDRRTGRIYVADSTNNRVLSWLNAATYTNGQAADKVFGQPDFTSSTANNGGISASTLSGPRGVAVDDNSNLYVADTNNNRILVYRNPNTLDNVADFVIGQANFATLGFGTTNAKLNGPRGIAIDSSNNLYVADTNNNRVLEFDTPLGTDAIANRVFGQLGIFTNSFTNNVGGANGTPTADNLNQPFGVGVDSQSNVYIADTFNNRVLVYTTPLAAGGNTTADFVVGQGVFTTSATGITSTTLNGPYRLVVDSADNLYVCDSNNNRVLEYNTPINFNGKAANLVFGQPNFTSNTANQGGTRSASTLVTPYDVAVDSANNVYIMDTGNIRVLGYDLPIANSVPTQTSLFPSVIAESSAVFSLRVDGAGFVQSSVVRINGSARTTTFIGPTRVEAVLTPADVATAGTATITVFTPAPGGGTSSLLNLTIYTRANLDTTADRIIGQPDFDTNTANTGGITARSLNAVVDMAVDPTSGRFWVADSQNNRVLSWTSAAAITNGQPADIVLGQPDFSSKIQNFGGVAGAPTASNLRAPSGVVVDASGNLYVSDTNNHRVLLYMAPIVSGASATRVFGQVDFVSGMSNAGGTVQANSLSGPFGLALDSNGNLYVADFLNSRVVVFFSPLTADTSADFVFGQGGVFTTNTSNKGTLALNGASCLNFPVSVALDAQNNVYISDFGNRRVLQFDTPLTTNAVADRVIGQNNDFTSNVTNLGGISNASLGGPYGVAVTRAGDLYVADFTNNRVLEYDTPLTSDLIADRVFGQGGSFSNNFFNNGGVSNNSLAQPRAASVDGSGNLYISDNGNNRVLMYDKPTNKTPVVLSPISATPAAQFVGLPVLFGYSVSDPDGDTITYTWDFGDGSSGTGAAPSHTYTAAGTFNPSVTASDGFGGNSIASTQVVITAPDAPVFTSLKVASGTAGAPFDFPIGVVGTSPITLGTTTLPDGLTFNGTNITGTPTVAGSYPVTVTATNLAGITTQPLVIIITGNGVSNSLVDSDGDGFSDEVEIAMGLDPKNIADTPFAGALAGTPEALFISKLSIGLNFAKQGNDSLQAAGVLTVPTGFTVAGAIVVVDVGGVVRSFTLTAKGASAKAVDTIKIGIKAVKGVVPAQAPKFSVKFSKGSWQGLLVDEGLTNAAATGVPKAVPVAILFNNKIFKTDVAQLYTAKANASGKTKVPSTGAIIPGR
jgi:sugar lactone lactonase YvrE